MTPSDEEFRRVGKIAQEFNRRLRDFWDETDSAEEASMFLGGHVNNPALRRVLQDFLSTD
jgi:hypothetical protein